MKVMFIPALSVFISASVFSAHHEVKGGFKGPSAKKAIQTIAEAKKASDDTDVMLTGTIVSSLGGDDYMFRDDTGDIEVDIDQHLWSGIEATPETRLIVKGEVDKDWNHVSIDVNSLALEGK